MTKFTEIGLPSKILPALEKMNYENLTPIQEGIIPAIREGRDVLACSQTGSGKTGAFLIPIMSNMYENKDKKAIVLAPTRELAEQIFTASESLIAKKSHIPRALLIGGASLHPQLKAIQANPKLIIGTPGRINDFLDSGKLNLNDFDCVVLDEMDRMLDMGFSIQIENILKSVSQKRQTLLFSATASKKIEKTTEKYLNNPVVVKIGDSNMPSKNVSQEIINLENKEKFDVLLDRLSDQRKFYLIFSATKMGTERIAGKLVENGIEAHFLHGDIKQSKRSKIIQKFRDKKFNVLVATDVAARGLDIPHIDVVINYDLPQSPEDYIHRIGRCSRSLEQKGISISFCSRMDKKRLVAIKSLIDCGEYEEEFETGGRSNSKRKLDSRIEKRKERRASTKVEYPEFQNNRNNRKPRTNGDRSKHQDNRGDRKSRSNSERSEYQDNRSDRRSKSSNERSDFQDNKNKRNTQRDSKKLYDMDKIFGDKCRNIKRQTAYYVGTDTANDRKKRLGH